jgi:branched-subunit amino acid ABC-type transport system permease component
MVSAFVAVWVMTALKLPFPLVYLIILIFVGVFGIVFQRLAYYPLRNRTFLPVLINTIGVSIFLKNATELVFGAQHRLIPPRTPRLNGKVERSHQTDEEEFSRLHHYSTQQDLPGCCHPEYYGAHNPFG